MGRGMWMSGRGAAIALLITLAGAARAQDAASTPPPPGATVKLTMKDAVQRALSSSPRVKGAEADLQGQVERRRGAWSDVGPRVTLDYTQAKWHEAQTASFGGNEIILRPEEAKTGTVTVVQPITGAFALLSRAQNEGDQEDVKAWSLSLAKGTTAFEAAEAWLKAYLAKRQLEIAQSSVAAAESQQRDASALERAGRMNRGDVLKLELAVSEAKARVAQARAGNDVVYAALKEAVGLPPEAPVELEGDLPVMQDGELEPQAAFKQAMDKRLEPKVAAGGVAAAQFGKKVARSNFSPSVNLFAKWDKNFGEPTGFGADPNAEKGDFQDKWVRSYGVQASWAIWNNGSHVFAMREASQGIARAEEGVRGAEAAVRLDVQAALANLKAARETLALAKVAVSQAAEAYRIEQVRFRTGSRSATDLVLAETSNASAQVRLVSAQTDVLTWSMRLKKALGDEQPQLP